MYNGLYAIGDGAGISFQSLIGNVQLNKYGDNIYYYLDFRFEVSIPHR